MKKILAVLIAVSIYTAASAQLRPYPVGGSGDRVYIPSGVLEDNKGVRYSKQDTGTALITDYGAVGDGVTNNATAFNAAIASGKRKILVPSGVFVLAGAGTGNAITTLLPYQSLEGTGEGSVIKLTTNDFAVRITNANVVEHLKFIGSGKLSGKQYQTPVQAFFAKNCKVTNILFENISGGSYEMLGGCIAVYGQEDPGRFTNNVSISNVRIFNCGYGITLGPRGEYCTVSDVHCDSSIVAIASKAGNTNISAVNGSNNKTGLLLLGGDNNSHSVYNNILLNHCDTALNMKNQAVTDEFTNVNCYYGVINIANCIRPHYNACQWYSNNLYLTGNTRPKFINGSYDTATITKHLVSGDDLENPNGIQGTLTEGNATDIDIHSSGAVVARSMYVDNKLTVCGDLNNPDGSSYYNWGADTAHKDPCLMMYENDGTQRLGMIVERANGKAHFYGGVYCPAPHDITHDTVLTYNGGAITSATVEEILNNVIDSWDHTTTNATPYQGGTQPVGGMDGIYEYTVTAQSGNNRKVFKMLFAIKQVSGTCTILGSPNYLLNGVGDLSGATVTISAFANGIVTEITGIAATNIDWHLEITKK